MLEPSGAFDAGTVQLHPDLRRKEGQSSTASRLQVPSMSVAPSAAPRTTKASEVASASDRVKRLGRSASLFLPSQSDRDLLRGSCALVKSCEATFVDETVLTPQGTEVVVFSPKEPVVQAVSEWEREADKPEQPLAQPFKDPEQPTQFNAADVQLPPALRRREESLADVDKYFPLGRALVDVGIMGNAKQKEVVGADGFRAFMRSSSLGEHE